MKIKIGTRGSKMALVQAQQTVDVLKNRHPDLEFEIVVIQTSGDWKPSHGETLLSAAAGGKGLFAKEIEIALMDGRVDIGVHALKDIETFMPQGLVIQHVLERDDPRDAFISSKASSIDELPENAVVGTSSARRGAILLSRRPDLKIVPFRGNADTRLKKLEDGQVDATILSVSGLERIGLTNKIASYLEPEAMLPAVCQGIIGIQARKDDSKILAVLDAINDQKTFLQATAERAVLAVLDGSCRTPIGSYAQWLDNGEMRLRALVASPEGEDIYKHEETAVIDTTDGAHALGLRVGQALKALTPKHCLEVNG